MTHVEFIELVRMMREAQKVYFRTRALQKLNLSKNLEMQVDQAVRELTGLPL